MYKFWFGVAVRRHSRSIKVGLLVGSTTFEINTVRTFLLPEFDEVSTPLSKSVSRRPKWLVSGLMPSVRAEVYGLFADTVVSATFDHLLLVVKRYRTIVMVVSGVVAAMVLQWSVLGSCRHLGNYKIEPGCFYNGSTRAGPYL